MATKPNSLTAKDEMPFGKYKGTKVSDLLLSSDGVGYLLWLRKQRFQQGDVTFFAESVTKQLDELIAINSKRFGKFKVDMSRVNGIEGLTTTPGAISHAEAYDKGWGEF